MKKVRTCDNGSETWLFSAFIDTIHLFTLIYYCYARHQQVFAQRLSFVLAQCKCVQNDTQVEGELFGATTF